MRCPNTFVWGDSAKTRIHCPLWFYMKAYWYLQLCLQCVWYRCYIEWVCNTFFNWSYIWLDHKVLLLPIRMLLWVTVYHHVSYHTLHAYSLIVTSVGTKQVNNSWWKIYDGFPFNDILTFWYKCIQCRLGPV